MTLDKLIMVMKVLNNFKEFCKFHCYVWHNDKLYNNLLIISLLLFHEIHHIQM